jgi:hypothetical protein
MRNWFTSIVLSNPRLTGDTIATICSELTAARSYNRGDLVRVRSLVDLFDSFHERPLELPLFGNFFSDFQRDTQLFYRDFFDAKFDGNSFGRYLELASDQFTREEAIVRAVFQKAEQDDILVILHCELLMNREERFLDGPQPAISFAFTATDSRPLKWLIGSYLRFGATLDRVYSACARYIGGEMMKVAANFSEGMKAQDVTRGIGDLIHVAQSLSAPYHELFGSTSGAVAFLEKQISAVWNSAELDAVNNFCTYIDTHIRSELHSTDDLEKFPGVVAEFYKRTEDKKKFSEVYNMGMVRRLIKMQTKLLDLEFPIIAAIRRTRAPEFAQPWSNYLKMMKESKELERDFTAEFPLAASSQFAPLIFAMRTFPLDKIEATKLHPHLQSVSQAFDAFYRQKHSSTKLVLLADVSIVEAKFHVPRNARSNVGRTYSVTSDLLCASILLYLAGRGRDGLTLREICDLVGDRNSVFRYVVRLCTNTCPILKRTARESKLDDSDVFAMNANFFSNATRVIIPSILVDKRKEKSDTAVRVEMDKALAIKAAGMRVLKMRNRIEQGEFENAVIKALMSHFRADGQMIRQSILDLENEDCLERAEEGGRIILIFIT